MSTDAPLTPPSWRDRTLLQWVGTGNPFYVISAGLFLVGLRLSFGSQTRDIDSWALMTGLAGYTLLLAAAALVLVRFARAWDDLRTVLLLVVLMFLATSVTFDELLVTDPNRGTLFYLGGLAFAVAVSEGLLRGIRLRLPAGFRLPYYLVLALFFLYPLALTPLLQQRSEALLWGLWGFAPAAGLAFLTLLPAVCRGSAYVRDSGSPWAWPFYPWSLFVFLAVAVVGRSFLLCWSLDLLGGRDIDWIIFGPYFLVPFGLAVAVVLLELGLVAGRRGAQWAALALTAGLVAVAAVGHRDDPVYTEFVGIFQERLGGTPLFLALGAAAAFYAYAAVRRVPLAVEALTLAVAAFAVIGPDTLRFRDLTPIETKPLIAAAALQLAVGVWRSEAWRYVAVGSAAAGWLATLAWRGYGSLREHVVGLDYMVVGLLLLPVAVLVSLVKAGALSRRTPRGEATG
jgi:hypothetical protein